MSGASVEELMAEVMGFVRALGERAENAERDLAILRSDRTALVLQVDEGTYTREDVRRLLVELANAERLAQQNRELREQLLAVDRERYDERGRAVRICDMRISFMRSTSQPGPETTCAIANLERVRFDISTDDTTTPVASSEPGRVTGALRGVGRDLGPLVLRTGQRFRRANDIVEIVLVEHDTARVRMHDDVVTLKHTIIHEFIHRKDWRRIFAHEEQTVSSPTVEDLPPMPLGAVANSDPSGSREGNDDNGK